MFGSLRAGGIAAAIALLSATVVGAGPSQALELKVASTSLPHQIAVSPESPQVAVPVQTEAVPADTQPSAVVPAAAAPAMVDSAEIAPAPSAPAIPLPPVKEHGTLAQLVAAHRSSDIPDRERECLAGAIYFESKGEPLPGQLAVGQVIANRAKSGRFPKSWCGVVLQRSQFSFVRGGSLPRIPRASADWKTAVAIAHIVANDLTDAVAPKSLFFHARYVSPNWRNMSKVATVGNHVFYR